MFVGVPPRRINEVVHGQRRITANTALRLARYFGTSAQFWLTLQDRHDRDVAEDRMAEQIAAITPRRPRDKDPSFEARRTWWAESGLAFGYAHGRLAQEPPRNGPFG